MPILLPRMVGATRRPSGLFTLNRNSRQQRGLVAWWPNGRPGPQGSELGTNIGALTDSTIEGVSDHARAVKFTSAGSTGASRVSAASAVNLPTGATDSFTISFWHQTSSYVSLSNAFGFGAPLNGNIGSAGQSRFVLQFGGSGNYYFFGHTSDYDFGVAWDLDNKPHQITVVGDGVFVLLYRDGVYRGQSSVPYSNFTTALTNIVAGSSHSAGTSPTSKVWDCRIYNRALTAADAWQLYDPATRYELYQVPSTRVFFDIPAGGGSSPQTITAPSATSVWTAIAATVLAAVSLAAPAATATWAALAPTAHQSVTVAPATAGWVAPTPAVFAGSVTVSAPIATANWVTPTPAVVQSGAVLAPPAIASWVAPTPAVLAGAITVSAPVATAAWTALTPSVTSGLVLVAPAATTAWAVPAVTVLSPVTVTAPVASGLWTVPTPSVVTGSGVIAAPVASASWVVPTASAVSIVTVPSEFFIVPAVGRWVYVPAVDRWFVV